MGMDATLMAIGPFEDRLLLHLDYDPWHYKNVKEGRRVVVTLVECRTTDASEALAEALGVGAMDLGDHVFDRLTREQHRRLMRFALKGEGSRAAECWAEDIDALARLRAWTFVFMPNA
jgi:hypothetical protein